MCLLLALGDSLETPFRILDEFDICLDSEARRLTIKSLIHVAKTSMSRRQFVFITPQDLSAIQVDDDITIHQMQPPRADATDRSPQSLDLVAHEEE